MADLVSNILSKFSGQPDTYDKKSADPSSNSPHTQSSIPSKSPSTRPTESASPAPFSLSSPSLAPLKRTLSRALGTDSLRSKYKFGRTLGAGTYGIVREAVGPDGKKVAIKIILKKNVKGNEQMVVDELRMLREMRHPHIVKFVDWFESRVCYKGGEAHHGKHDRNQRKTNNGRRDTVEKY